MKAYLINMHLLVPRSRSSAKIKVKYKGYISQKWPFLGHSCFTNTSFFLLNSFECLCPSHLYTNSITVSYLFSAPLGDVVHSCNQDCGCSTRYFEPVCTGDNIQYFSACHAGCTNVSTDEKVKACFHYKHFVTVSLSLSTGYSFNGSDISRTVLTTHFQLVLIYIYLISKYVKMGLDHNLLQL